MSSTKRHWLLTLFVIIMLFQLCMPNLSEANSAEPPSLIILVDDPLRTTKMTLYDGTVAIEPRVYDTLWERKFNFFKLNLSNKKQYSLHIETTETSYTIQVPHLMKQYRTVYQFNPKTGELNAGVPPWRNALLIAMRLLSTLFIEGLVFYWLHFRHRDSWIKFIALNLLTQGVLNLWLNELSYMDGYLIFTLIYGELFVFAVEALFFAMLIKEQTPLRRIFAAVLVNMTSLLLGGYLILRLPLPM